MTHSSRPSWIGFVLLLVVSFIATIIIINARIKVSAHQVPEGYELKCNVRPKPAPLKIEVYKTP